MEELGPPHVVDGRVAVGAVFPDERVEANDRRHDLDHHRHDEQLGKPRLVGVAARQDVPECDGGQYRGGRDEYPPDGRDLHAARGDDDREAHRRQDPRDQARPVAGSGFLETTRSRRLRWLGRGGSRRKVACPIVP